MSTTSFILKVSLKKESGITAPIFSKDSLWIFSPKTFISPSYLYKSKIHFKRVVLPYNVKQLLHKIRRYFYRLIYIQNFYFNFFIRSLSVRILICSIAIAFNFSILSVASIPSFIKTAFKFSRFDKHTNCDISA